MPDDSQDIGVRDFFFDLSFLGDIHKTAEYTLMAFGQRFKLSYIQSADSTHQATNVKVKADVIQLIRVYGPPTDESIPTLALTSMYTPGTNTLYAVEDIAKSILFLHPQITVLTAEHADKVLNTSLSPIH